MPENVDLKKGNMEISTYRIYINGYLDLTTPCAVSRMGSIGLIGTSSYRI